MLGIAPYRTARVAWKSENAQQRSEQNNNLLNGEGEMDGKGDKRGRHKKCGRDKEMKTERTRPKQTE